MDELAAINFNIRESLEKLEVIREKIKKLSEKEDFQKQIKDLLGSQINNCTSTLLIVNDILNEIENGVDGFEAELLLKSLKEN